MPEKLELKVKHVLTGQEMTISVSDNFTSAAAAQKHVEKVMGPQWKVVPAAAGKRS